MSTVRYQLTTSECVELLREGSIGRLCVIEDGYPLAIPINYRLTDRDHDVRIAARTSPSSVLGRYEGPASLEVDDVSLANGRAWSVIVRGMLHSVHGDHDLPDPRPLPGGDHAQWLVLEPSMWTGRRFVVEATTESHVVDWQIAPA